MVPKLPTSTGAFAGFLSTNSSSEHADFFLSGSIGEEKSRPMSQVEKFGLVVLFSVFIGWVFHHHHPRISTKP